MPSAENDFQKRVIMKEQRRHQRIRFNTPPSVKIGKPGSVGVGELENLALGALVFRSDLSLKVGESFGCEFVLFGSSRIDFSAVVVSRIGDLYNARFQPGPLSELLIAESIENALASGKAAILSINDVRGRKVMRVVGSLSGRLRNDFMHGLEQMGVDDLDLSEVTAIDADGLALCRRAVDDYSVVMLDPAPCVIAAMGAPVSLSLDRSLTLIHDE
jgi:hypothetical protein